LPSVSEILSSQSGIIITEQISAATSGGYQTIAAKVASGDILAVIFLRDFQKSIKSGKSRSDVKGMQYQSGYGCY
jgi:methylglyoxal synthase